MKQLKTLEGYREAMILFFPNKAYANPLVQ